MPRRSFAGISVPEGQPGAVRELGSAFAGMAASTQDVSAELRGLPGSLTRWNGPASVAFAGASAGAAQGAEAGVQAFQHAATAADRYATELDEAKEDARQAIQDAEVATRAMRPCPRLGARRRDAAGLRRAPAPGRGGDRIPARAHRRALNRPKRIVRPHLRDQPGMIAEWAANARARRAARMPDEPPPQRSA